MFDKRISYSGDRPPFPSWYFTDKLLEGNEFYIYDVMMLTQKVLLKQ